MVDSLNFEELKYIVTSLCRTLECAVCLGVLQKDTVTCVNGHCICAKCQGKEAQCPTCREGFSNVRQNSLVCQVLDFIPRTCRNLHCSYFVKSGDDHETYCHFNPTECMLCYGMVPALHLGDHVKDMHEKAISTEKNESLLTSGVDLGKTWYKTFLLSEFGHFFWLLLNNSPATNAVSFTIIPVFLKKPIHDVNVKICIKKEEKKEYKAIRRVKMNINVKAVEDNCLLIPISVIKHCYNREVNGFFFGINIKRENSTPKGLPSKALQVQETVADSGPPSEKKMQIFVRTMKNTIILNVKSSDTIKNVKTKIENKEGTPAHVQSLIYRSRKMEDGGTLYDYGIEKESLLQMFIKHGGTKAD